MGGAYTQTEVKHPFCSAARAPPASNHVASVVRQRYKVLMHSIENVVGLRKKTIFNFIGRRSPISCANDQLVAHPNRRTRTA